LPAIALKVGKYAQAHIKASPNRRRTRQRGMACPAAMAERIMVHCPSKNSVVRRALCARGSHNGVYIQKASPRKNLNPIIIGLPCRLTAESFIHRIERREVGSFRDKAYFREAASGPFVGDCDPAFDASLTLMVPTLFPFGRPRAGIGVAGTIRPYVRRPQMLAVENSEGRWTRVSKNRKKDSKTSNGTVASSNSLVVLRGQISVPNLQQPPMGRVFCVEAVQCLVLSECRAALKRLHGMEARATHVP
jgi:hypothetical protein